jgi:hypothetical protein
MTDQEIMQSLKNYTESLYHWARCFRDGTLDDSFASEIAYLLEDKAHDLKGTMDRIDSAILAAERVSK